MIDLHPHADPCYRCRATAWEIVGEFVPMKGKRQDVVACAFCGVRMRVDQSLDLPRATAAPREEFRFQYGRFKGMTLAEADREKNGRRYLEHLRDTNEKLRARIEEYLSPSA